ncbi:uncharacterized protein LOC132273714 [Cornus florida]|uniref:uncharacterized protein LOC132273714 n=1 Tax=Cornus florida TaxID=4283 RepID=UPI00289995C3|nr:uncharacterized protein LOC132273714 [Cornus florida]
MRTQNPSGVIPPVRPMSIREKEVFINLGVDEASRDTTYLVVFLACWLCKFAFPAHPGNMIRPGTFKVASMLADGCNICLSIPVLASIYRGLNEIISSPVPGSCSVIFPIHYVFGWLSEYFRTNFTAPNINYWPRMTLYAGEGGARFFDDFEAQNLFKLCKGINLTRMAKRSSKQRLIVNNGEMIKADSDTLISLRSCYLTLHQNDCLIIEPYNPQRFSRQFGYHQDIPGKLKNDFRSCTLKEFLKHWKSSVHYSSGCDALFPSTSSHQKSSVTKAYAKWWSSVYIDPFTQE